MGNKSKDELLGLINKTNSSDIKPHQVSYGPTADAADLTKVKVTGRNGYRDSVVVTYTRLGLDHLFSYFQPRILVDDSEGVLPPNIVVARIQEQYPVNLDVDEVIIVHETRADGDYYVVTAKDNSFVYKDTVTVGTRPRVQIPINKHILPESTSYVYPNNTMNRAYARIYSGGWYLPECGVELSRLLVGELADTNLVWLTTIVSGDTWHLDATEPSTLNMAKAHVSYNGPVGGINLHPDDGMMLYRFPEATHVVLVELSDTLCTGMVGKLTYYYGERDEKP